MPEFTIIKGYFITDSWKGPESFIEELDPDDDPKLFTEILMVEGLCGHWYYTLHRWDGPTAICPDCFSERWQAMREHYGPSGAWVNWHDMQNSVDWNAERDVTPIGAHDDG